MQALPSPQSIISSVVADTIAGFLASVGRQVWRGSIRRPPDADRAIAAAVEKAAREMPLPPIADDPEVARQLREFLTLPEVTAVVRQLFSLSVIDRANEMLAQRQNERDSPAYSGESIAPPVTDRGVRQHFRLLVSKHLAGPAAQAPAIADALLHSLASGTESALRASMAVGGLGAADAIAAARTRLVLDELRHVVRSAEFLASAPQLDVPAVVAFEAEYRASAASQAHFLRPPDLDRSRRVPLRSLYQEPLLLTQNGPSAEPRELAHELMQGPTRIVVLGDPGGGKSSLVQKFLLDVNEGSVALPSRTRTATRVVLRDYAPHWEEGRSIRDFVELEARATHQLDVPEDAFEYLLLAGHLAIAFDGLDEILDTRRRSQIVEAVNAFARHYATAPILVTSRTVGYEAAPLGETFRVLMLAPFNSDQVHGYATKWFALSSDELAAEERRRLVSDFMVESAVAADLRENPMMLSLLCSLYRGRQSIPRNRPELYRKCAVLLFERWDSSRGIKVELPFEHHLRFALQHVAHWLYTTPDLQDGVSRTRLVAKTADYLCGSRFDEIGKAERAAESFVAFCTGRAWVFTDVGLDRHGEGLYRFTHRTFLEYFTAAHLVRSLGTSAALLEELLPRIARREWDLVAQLAFQILADEREGAADELLAGVLAEARTAADPSSAEALLEFVSRTLDYLVPSRATIRSVVRAITAFHLRAATSEPSGLAFAGLLTAGVENRDAVIGGLTEELTSAMHGEDTDVAVSAALTTFALAKHVDVARRNWDQAYERSLWREQSDILMATNRDRIRDLSAHDPDVCLTAVHRGFQSVISLCAHHGVQQVFRTPVVGSPTQSPAWGLICDGLAGPSDDTRETLKAIAPLFLSAPRPWITGRIEETLLASGEHLMLSDRTLSEWEPDADESFSLFCLLAPLFDASLYGRVPVVRSVEATLRDVVGNGGEFVRLLGARRSRASSARLREDALSLGLKAPQADFVVEWCSGSVLLLEPRELARDIYGNRKSAYD